MKNTFQVIFYFAIFIFHESYLLDYYINLKILFFFFFMSYMNKYYCMINTLQNASSINFWVSSIGMGCYKKSSKAPSFHTCVLAYLLSNQGNGIHIIHRKRFSRLCFVSFSN